MSDFLAALGSAQTDLETAFGEQMQITPMIAGRYTASGSPDSSRTVRSVTGIYAEKPIDLRMLDQAPGMGRELGSVIKADKLSVSVQTSDLMVDGVLEIPRPSDQIVRVEFPDEPILQVTSAQSDGGVRTIIFVTKILA